VLDIVDRISDHVIVGGTGEATENVRTGIENLNEE